MTWILAAGSKISVEQKRRKTRRFGDVRCSHRRRLISAVGNERWRCETKAGVTKLLHQQIGPDAATLPPPAAGAGPVAGGGAVRNLSCHNGSNC